MINLPPWLEKFLTGIGVNTPRLKWKLYYMKEGVERKISSRKPKEQGHKYKTCRHCGHLALAEDKVCRCGRKLPSYTAHRFYQLLALAPPEGKLVTIAFLGIIVILFVLQVGVFGVKALMAPSGSALMDFGAYRTISLQQGEYWRFFTMALCHIGIIHIAFNTIALSQTLPRFEEELGTWQTLFLITFCQVGAGVAHNLFNSPYVITAGASGVAFGVIGFGVVYFHFQRFSAERNFFFQWFVYALIFGFLVGANNSAHIGGFLAGGGLGLLLGNMRFGYEGIKNVLRIGGLLSLAVWMICLGFLIFNLISGMVK